MNAVTNATSHAVASLQSLKSGLANVKASLPSVAGDPFLRMGTDGEWIYGAENVEVEEGSLWAVNPMSLAHGYASWTRHPAESKKPNTLEGERMVPMTAAKPDKNSLPDTGWDWADQVGFQLMCASGEDKGEQTLYKTTSKGGIGAVNTLIGAIMAQLDVDPAKPVPLVRLECDSYKHKVYGKTYIPIFTIAKWVEMDQLPTDAPDEVEQVKDAVVETKPAEEPTRRRRAGAVPETGQQAAQQEKPATVPVDEAAVRKAKLLAELAALEGNPVTGEGPPNAAQAEAPATGDAPRRRRRG